ncbi:MAG: hypothetical protein VKJ04_01965 [Vampirovibrionales bacterium]|nr:hypothetical protein [Vampirovibrionales bacterium]
MAFGPIAFCDGFYEAPPQINEVHDPAHPMPTDESDNNRNLKLDAGVTKSGAVTLEHVTFYYKTDEEVRFVEKKSAYQAKTRGQLPPDVAEAFADEAYAESSVEKELDKWRYHGGPAPNVITAKAHLFNESSQAKLDMKLNVTVRAKVSNLLVDPKTLLVDYGYLKKSARWRTLSKKTITIDALAAGEDYLEDVMRFELLKFTNTHKGQWPSELEVSVSSPDADKSVSASITLTPDHFVVPVLY